MKKPFLDNKFTSLLVALIFICTIVSGSGAVYAWFSDRDSAVKELKMATVDIELIASDTESFTINNNSNIGIYLRAGIILELLDEKGYPVIADTRDILIEADSGSGWEAINKEIILEDGGIYKKWFLEYRGIEYTEVVPSNKTISCSYTIRNIPNGCELKVNVVPEAIQADDDKDALNYLKDKDIIHVNPAW